MEYKYIDPYTNIELIAVPSAQEEAGSDSGQGTYIANLKSLQIGSGDRSIKANSEGMWAGARLFADAKFSFDPDGNVVMASATIIGGTVRYGKTSFTDSTHAGYYLGAEGMYFGAAGDSTRLKYTLATGIIDFIGDHSSGTVGGRAISYITNVSDPTSDITPVGLSVSAKGTTVSNSGGVSAYITLTWSAIIGSSTFDYYLIRYKPHSYINYNYITVRTNTITIEGLVPNVEYDFGIASVNKYGTPSSFSSDISETMSKDSVAPTTVTAGSATAGIQYVILEWTHNSDTDLDYYNIYRNTINDSGTATLIGKCKTNYFTDGGLTGGTPYYYWLKAVDTSGNISASFSDVKTATPRNVQTADVEVIAATKVLIDGSVYLTNWRHSSDLTKIDGGNIFTGSITTTQLNFTPVQNTNVIASINASAEGIRIDADNIYISGSATFASGYDPTSKVAAQGGSYASAASGARVLIFPSSNIGLQIIDDGGNDVFKVLVGGTDLGDVVIGAYSSGQGLFYDKSLVAFTMKGTFQTATTGQRITISSADNYLKFFDANDNLLATLGGSTDGTNRYLDLATPTDTDSEIMRVLAQKTDGTNLMARFYSKGYQSVALYNENSNSYRNTNNTPQLYLANLGTGVGIRIINSSDYESLPIYITNSRSASAQPIMKIDQDAIVSTHFRRIFVEENTGHTLWISDGTTPNGSLSGSAGDICFNGDSGKAYYCTGTTSWTAM
jgi:hypothetical protein